MLTSILEFHLGLCLCLPTLWGSRIQAVIMKSKPPLEEHWGRESPDCLGGKPNLPQGAFPSLTATLPMKLSDMGTQWPSRCLSPRSSDSAGHPLAQTACESLQGLLQGSRGGLELLTFLQRRK